MADFYTPGIILSAVIVYAAYKAINIVPQAENWLVERFGRFHTRLDAGPHLIVPFMDRVVHRVGVLERQLPGHPINAITLDNVNIQVELAILYRITDAAKTVYRIQNVDQAIATIVNGSVRSVIGKTEFDRAQSNRRQLSEGMNSELSPICTEWGIELTRVEILEIKVDDKTRASMQLQLDSERNRRAVVAEAQGQRESAQLKADGELYTAEKQAQAKRILAEAEAFAVTTVAKAIVNNGQTAIEFEVKKLQAQAITALGNGQNTKIILLPTDITDGLRSIMNRLGNGGGNSQ